MQGVESHAIAEDSCFIKHHSQDGGADCDNARPVLQDVERASVNIEARPPSAVDEKNIPHGSNEAKDTSGQPQTSNSKHLGMTELDCKDDFPEGGLRAWSVVIGGFCGSFSVFALINSNGVLLEYLQANQLKDYTSSQIGWIFGVDIFLTFFCGAPVGPIFDAYGPRAMVFAGSVLLAASILLLGLCTQYWHFFLVYSILNGLGGALLYTPCMAAISHFFLTRRGYATGVAMTAGSVGGVIFPLMLQKLFPLVGFAWATRIVGFILVFLLVLANLLVRSRLPRRPVASIRSISPDLTVFKDLPFTFVTLGIFLMEWGLFVPLTYITTYAVSHGHSSSFSFKILAVLNAGSFFGRFSAGLVADMIGRLNTLILSIACCVIACFALWLPAGDNTAMLIVFAIIFGVVSGSNLSLSPVCVGQLCKTENYGRYFASCWMLVAFGTLTSLPIGGGILSASGGAYSGAIVFTGLSYVAALLCLITARVLAAGWGFFTVF